MSNILEAFGYENINPQEQSKKNSWTIKRASFFVGGMDLMGEGDGLFLLTVSMLRASSKDLCRLFPPLHTHLRR